MEITLAIVTLLLLGSLGLNAFLIYRSRNAKIQKSPPYDVQQLARDLAAYGVSLIKIERINPEDILLRSPNRT